MKTINRFLHIFTWILIGTLGVILLYTTLEFIAVVIRTIITRTEAFDLSRRYLDVENLFLVHVQGLVAGILLITIIIELIKTLITSLDEKISGNYIVIFTEIATIAVIRHLFIYELDHLGGINIIGIAALLLVLGLLNYVFRKNPEKKQDNQKT